MKKNRKQEIWNCMRTNAGIFKTVIQEQVDGCNGGNVSDELFEVCRGLCSYQFHADKHGESVVDALVLSFAVATLIVFNEGGDTDDIPQEVVETF